MPTSDLLKTARAMDDPQMRWRVTAAQFTNALTVALDSTKAGTDQQRYALWALQNPTQVDPSLLAFVVSDTAVVAQLNLVGPVDDPVADTTAVDDAAIKSVVSAKWSLVAKKY